jgi:Hyaluronidase
MNCNFAISQPEDTGMLKLIFSSIWLLIFLLEYGQTFEVIWNVPTQLCRRKNVLEFPALLESANITHNPGDMFKGDRFRIFYSPGNWPSMEHQKVENGGMPHQGNLTLHIERFQQHIEKEIGENFTGRYERNVV